MDAVVPTERGFGSDLTAIVECENGPFFVKAMRNKPGGRRDQMFREKAINPFVRALAPAVLWSVEDTRWVVLGFERVEGRRSDLLPGASDLPTVVELINRVGEFALPEPALGWREERWDWWADEGAPAFFRGDTLLHGDINPSNLLIGERRNWVVDWAWPTRGAAFIDPALLVTQLVAGGHSPEEAETWAAGCPAWSGADPKAIDAWAVAYARMTRVRALRKPDAPWLKAMADAIESWANHRGITDIL
ncbi:protein kinase [Streptomyces profundus]|uniref:protein kinase n=1 Tax=Streptomyces profundus TaxID=2867410 RepID=UPI001D1610E9|nr:protein kinase [Streptomyces sp. MA3_2.13]